MHNDMSSTPLVLTSSTHITKLGFIVPINKLVQFEIFKCLFLNCSILKYYEKGWLC